MSDPSSKPVQPRNPKSATRRSTSLKAPDELIQELCEVFKLLADKSRMRILMSLAHSGEMHVTALCDLLKQSQPAVSHHLTLLRARRLVGYRRDGKHNYYRIESGTLSTLLERAFDECGEHKDTIQFGDFALQYQRLGES